MNKFINGLFALGFSGFAMFLLLLPVIIVGAIIGAVVMIIIAIAEALGASYSSPPKP